jgi:hypothetical protein
VNGRDGAGFSRAFVNDARFLQRLHVKMDGRGGFQPHRLSDLPDGGGISLLLHTIHQILVDFPLHPGKLFHRGLLPIWPQIGFPDYSTGFPNLQTFVPFSLFIFSKAKKTGLSYCYFPKTMVRLMTVKSACVRGFCTLLKDLEVS